MFLKTTQIGVSHVYDQEVSPYSYIYLFFKYFLKYFLKSSPNYG